MNEIDVEIEYIESTGKIKCIATYDQKNISGKFTTIYTLMLDNSASTLIAQPDSDTSGMEIEFPLNGTGNYEVIVNHAYNELSEIISGRSNVLEI